MAWHGHGISIGRLSIDSALYRAPLAPLAHIAPPLSHNTSLHAARLRTPFSCTPLCLMDYAHNTTLAPFSARICTHITCLTARLDLSAISTLRALATLDLTSLITPPPLALLHPLDLNTASCSGRGDLGDVDGEGQAAASKAVSKEAGLENIASSIRNVVRISAACKLSASTSSWPHHRCICASCWRMPAKYRGSMALGGVTDIMVAALNSGISA